MAVAGFTDGFGFYLASDELIEVAAASRDGLPRVTERRRAGGWQIETAAGQRPVVLARAVIDGRVHFLTGERWAVAIFDGDDSGRLTGRR